MLVRFGVSMEKDLLESFDHFIIKRGFHNRSEAIRDLIREKLSREKGFKVTDVDVRFMGYCSECQRHLQQEVNDKELAQVERR